MQRYVDAYRPQLAELVAEETYTQHDGDAATRELVSDFAIVRADDGMWVGFRDVWKVDGRELPDRRDRAERLFGAGRLNWTTAGHIVRESARYNVSERLRDFNTPIAALELLGSSRAWCCRIRARPPARDAATDARSPWTVEVEERERPTLIRSPDGGPEFARLRATVDPESGTVYSYDIRVGRRNPVTLAVVFAESRDLGMWLPAEMTESFRTTSGVAVGRARYRDWRRFQASARIVGE